MKWFTKKRLWGPEDEDDYFQDYWDHVEDIAPLLPISLRTLATEVSLHDARVEAFSITEDTVTLVLIRGDSDDNLERVTLTYGHAHVVDPTDDGPDDLYLLTGPTEFLHDEVDILDDNMFAHRIVVWPTGQLSIAFRHLEMDRHPASLEDWNLLRRRPPIPRAKQTLPDAWLDFEPPLIRAATIGPLSEVRALLDAGVAPDTSDDTGLTALRQAASRNRLDVCRLLLDAGATVDIRDESGETPMMAAFRAGSSDLMGLLSSRGADPLGGLSDGGVSAIHRAASMGNVDAVQFLLHRGVGIDALDEYGFSPLMTAAEEPDGAAMVQFLLEQGANPLLRSGAALHDGSSGNRPAELAARMENYTAATILRRAEVTCH